jgi:hypothetical protein
MPKKLNMKVSVLRSLPMIETDVKEYPKAIGDYIKAIKRKSN